MTARILGSQKKDFWSGKKAIKIDQIMPEIVGATCKSAILGGKLTRSKRWVRANIVEANSQIERE